MNILPEWAVLGVDIMDERHNEFWGFSQKLKTATDDAIFLSLFRELYLHTKAHFEAEESDMGMILYQNEHEHKIEHRKAIEELEYFMEKAKTNKIAFAKSFVKERLDDWFRSHLLNMDSDLARAMKLK